MNLVSALRLLPKHIFAKERNIIAFVGAGGKTTAIFQTAPQLEQLVIVTATSRLGAWQIPLADKHIIAESPAQIDELDRGTDHVILITGSIQDDKTKPVNDDALSWLRDVCEHKDIPLLIEADGSKQRPLKAPADHEPAIPSFVDMVVVVAGLSNLGKLLTEENVHRPEIFARISGLKINDPITAESLARVLTHPRGGLKNIPVSASKTAILNQADTDELQSQAKSLSTTLLSKFDSVIVSSLAQEKIHAVYEPVAGIILAAGESKRYGKPKQLLDWRGQPFVRVVAKTALEANLSPVIVVTGSNAEQVEATVNDLPIKIVRNHEWQEGQASSIRAGVRALPEQTGASIFLLSDQPQLTTTVLNALVENHATKLQPVLIPMVQDQRANPVLFDRVAFKDLLELTGDIGGRSIFHKHRVEYLPWHDDRLLLDVDTPEHYERLITDDTL